MKNVGSERPTNSKEFTENYSAMEKAIEKVDSLAKRLIAGGSENSKARHIKRGKMLLKRVIIQYTMKKLRKKSIFNQFDYKI